MSMFWESQLFCANLLSKFIGGRNTTGPILKAETGYVKSNISYIQTTKYIRIIIILHNNWDTPFEVIITSVDVWTFLVIGYVCLETI